MNIIMGSLAPILFFYLTKELFRDKKLPLTASILLFISPTYLFISSTESYTAPALFYAIITFLFLFKFFNKNQLNYLVISLLALALTIFMRQEYILVLIPYFITFFSYNNKKIPTNQLFLIGLLLLILVPYSSELMHYYSNTGYDKFLHGKVIQTEDWITSFGKNYIKLGSENLLPNLKTLFSNQCILLANVFLALCAIPFIIKKHKKQFIFISAYFGTFFLAYTFMHTEGFHNSGLKYITGLLIPVILLSSYCINTVANKIQKKGGKNAALFVRILILSVILICSIVSVIDMAGNNSGAYYVREYQTLKNLDYKINTSCTPICNGRDCIFPSAFDFRQKHIAITSLGRLKMLLESNNSNCYYFYIGYIDEQSDKNEGNKRIYDIEKLTLELTNNSFQLILEKEIRNEKKIYLFERK